MSRRDANSEISPELMLRAYAAGIFPMAKSKSAETVFWVDPRKRGILPLDKFHIPKSLRFMIHVTLDVIMGNIWPLEN